MKLNFSMNQQCSFSNKITGARFLINWQRSLLLLCPVEYARSCSFGLGWTEIPNLMTSLVCACSHCLSVFLLLSQSLPSFIFCKLVLHALFTFIVNFTYPTFNTHHALAYYSSFFLCVAYCAGLGYYVIVLDLDSDHVAVKLYIKSECLS